MNDDRKGFNVTHDMIVKYLRKMKGRKAPGIDGLTRTTIKKIFSVTPEFIIKIINRCFSEGAFPEQWKIAKVIILN